MSAKFEEYPLGLRAEWMEKSSYCWRHTHHQTDRQTVKHAHCLTCTQRDFLYYSFTLERERARRFISFGEGSWGPLPGFHTFFFSFPQATFINLRRDFVPFCIDWFGSKINYLEMPFKCTSGATKLSFSDSLFPKLSFPFRGTHNPLFIAKMVFAPTEIKAIQARLVQTWQPWTKETPQCYHKSIFSVPEGTKNPPRN